MPLVEENGSEAARSTLTGSRKALLDETKPEMSVDQSAFRTRDGARQDCVVDTRLGCVLRESRQGEDPHSSLVRNPMPGREHRETHALSIPKTMAMIATVSS
jgi:hypothetical protein